MEGVTGRCSDGAVRGSGGVIRALTAGWVIPSPRGWFPHRGGAQPLTGGARSHHCWRVDPLTAFPRRSLRGVGPSPPPSSQHAAR